MSSVQRHACLQVGVFAAGRIRAALSEASMQDQGHAPSRLSIDVCFPD